jgi:very-short-patch-repair endonuclease
MIRIINNIKEKEKRIVLRKQETPEEKILWEILRNKKLGYKWKRQVSIGVYVADFYCREKGLVIELDGNHHVTNKEYDLIREEYFKSTGVTTLRFWNYEIHNNIKLVKDMIIEKSKQLPSPFRRGVGGEVGADSTQIGGGEVGRFAKRTRVRAF